MAGSQIVKCGRIKTSRAKIRRTRHGEKGAVAARALRVFRISFLLNDFSQKSRSLEQATHQYGISAAESQTVPTRETSPAAKPAMRNGCFRRL